MITIGKRATGLFAGAVLLGCAGLRPFCARAASPILPGPDAVLYGAPYYTCKTNYYVSTTGSDDNPGTQQSPWRTLQHANDSGPVAGECINVEKGTYASGVLISHGGNLASSTGYVVYRCTTMDACIVTDVGAGGQNGSFVWNYSEQPMPASYVILDGFTMAASKPTVYGQGVELLTGDENSKTAPNSVHHIWILNSIISGYGQSGVQMNDGEYFFVVHNTIYNNSRVGCSAQGSGVSYAVLKSFPKYVRTPDDSNNPILGKIGSFNNAIEWNVIYNNAITGCGSQKNPYDTDGNGIILDTLNNAGSTNVTYPGYVLVAFNITYNDGARGIHLYNSENATIANNSCYNNDLDPFNGGTYRPCIGDLNGYNIVFFNNLAWGIAANPPNSAQCTDPKNVLASCEMYNNAYTGGLLAGSKQLDSFTNNISYCSTLPGSQGYGCNAMFNGDSFSCNSNNCNTNPKWVSVGQTSTGTETSQPVSANFALATGSPAKGKGLIAPYLNSQSVDIGACTSQVTVCPTPANKP
jgi:parallel beta-helix repeat protein